MEAWLKAITRALTEEHVGWLPVFSLRFHMQPSEFWNLTVYEFHLYVEALERLSKG